MSELQQFPTLPNQPFRLDVPLHQLLQQPSREVSPQPPTLGKAETLPTAVFPQCPELFHDLDEQDIAAHETVLQTGKRHWPASKAMKTMRGWMFPYFKSRILPGEFQPIVCPGRLCKAENGGSERARGKWVGIYQTPEEVVDDALRVLANGGGLTVPGALNKFSVFAQRLIPRSLVPRLVAKMSRA